MEKDEELKLNGKALKDNLEKIELLEKEAETLRKAHFRYEEIMTKIPKLRSNVKKTHRFLSNNIWRLEPKLKEIAKKLIEAKENHKLFDKNGDYLLFDEITDNFVSYGSDGESYHLELIKTHFRHYDVMEIIKSVERITEMKVKEWFLLTTDSLHRPAWNLSITLIKDSSSKGDNTQEMKK